MNNLRQFWLLIISIASINAEWRSPPKQVTAEHGSDLSLSCTFQNRDNDETIVQWLYQNVTDNMQNHRSKSHWRPLFLNAQSLTPTETRYSIQQKMQQINRTFIAYSTILTLAKVTVSDEGRYMCKSLLPQTIQMTYQVRVIESFDINPKQLLIPVDNIRQYSIRLICILKDNHTGRRHHEIYWWHNNKRLGSQTNRYARIIKNFTQHSFTSTLFYTGEPANVKGNYICESEPLRRHISVEFQTNNLSNSLISSYTILIMWILLLIFMRQNID